MKQKFFRRTFIQRSFLALAGASLVRNRVQSSGVFNEPFAGQYDHPNETIKTIHDLHSTHGNFTDEEIPDDQIELIKQSCVRAANSSNMQTYSVLIVRDREVMKQVCGYAGSCLMLFSVDYNRLIAGAKALELSYHPDNMNSFVTGCTNTGLAAQTATIAARSLGIDALLNNGIHRGDMERLWEILELPAKQCFPLVALVLGYADKGPEHKKGRLSGKGIFHENKYHYLTDDEINEISGIYDDPDRHLGVRENWHNTGRKNYLEWLFKDWTGKNSEPTREETQIFTQLKKRGFVDLQAE